MDFDSFMQQYVDGNEGAALPTRRGLLPQARFVSEHAAATTPDDRFADINNGVWDVFALAFDTLGFISDKLGDPAYAVIAMTSGIAVRGVDPSTGLPRTADTYVNNVWSANRTNPGFDSLTVRGDEVDVVVDLTKGDPPFIDAFKEDTDKVKAFLAPLGIKIVTAEAGEWQPQQSELGIQELARAQWPDVNESSVDDGGYPELTPGENLTPFLTRTGVRVRVRFQLRPERRPGDYNYAQLRVQTVITLPVDFFHWLNGSLGVRAAKFPYTTAVKWVKSALRVYCSGGAGEDNQWPVYVETPQMVKNRLDKYTAGIPGFQPRVNERGWSISPNGAPFKPGGLKGETPQRHGEILIERQNALDDVYTQLSNLQRDPKAMLDPAMSEKIDALRGQIDEIETRYRGRVAVIDWINDKMLRITADNHEELVELNGTRALDANTEWDLMEQPISGPKLKKPISEMVARLDNWIYSDWRRKLNDGQDLERPKSILQAHQDLLMNASGRVGGGRSEIKLKHLAGLDFDDLDDNAQGGQDKVNCFTIHMAFKRVWENPGPFLQNSTEYSAMGFAGWLLEAIGSGDQDAANLLRARAMNAQRRNIALSSTTTSIAIPNIEVRPGRFEAMMPHQLDANAALDADPDSALLDVSPGGGKASLLIINILRRYSRGTARRANIITASNLVPPMITEINSLCNGKVNAIPMRADILFDMVRNSGWTSYRQFLDWANALPPNTIFVTAYSDYTSTRVYFEDFDVPARYGIYDRPVCQFAQLMGMIGFDFVPIDESQHGKNPASARTKGMKYMSSRAKAVVLASGTMINNTVLDMHGQMSLVNPAVLGTVDQFKDDYGVEKGLITSVKNATAFRNKLRQSSSLITKRRPDWAFMLPDLVPEFIYAQMTARQTTYYNKLMQEAYVEIRRELDKIKGKGKGKKAAEAPAGSDDDDENSEEARIMSMLQQRLQIVEQFLVAPDLNKDYTHPEDGSEPPSGPDLVSPAVLAADQKIDSHFADRSNTGKIIVCGIHRAASVHFMRHSRHANKFVRFTAGDLESIRVFREDPNVLGLAADAGGMKVGHNLQIASRCILLQSFWAPGDYEQLISRMYRPDPRGQYNRTSVAVDNMLIQKVDGEATLGVAKMMRLISKSVANAQVSNEGITSWDRVAHQFDELPLLSMNLELVFDFRMNDASQFIRAWNQLGAYETVQMGVSRREIAQKIEARTGENLLDANGRVADMAKFTRLCMVPISADQDLPGSRRVYVPWIDHADPPDPNGIGLKLVATDAITPKTPVMTEYGPGVVLEVKDNRLKVQTAIGAVFISRNAVAYAPKEDGQTKLRGLLRDLGRHALVPPGAKLDPRLRIASPDKPTPAGPGRAPLRPGVLPPTAGPVTEAQPAGRIAPKPANVLQPEPDGEPVAESINLRVGVVNGMPMLYTLDDNADWLGEISKDWVQVGRHLTVEFSNYKGASDFIDALALKFYMTNPVYNRLRAGLEDMRRGRTLRADTLPNATTIRNFMAETHRKLGKKEGLPVAKPYWVTRGTEVRLAFDVASHDPLVLRWLAKVGRPMTGVRRINDVPSLWVNFFRTAQEVANDLKIFVAAMRKRGTAVDVKALKADLAQANETLKTLRRNTAARDREDR